MFPNEPKLARLIAAGERRRRECHAALRDFLRSAEFRRLGIALAWLAGARSWYPAPPEGADQPVSLRDFAADVLDRRLRKLARTDDLAAPGGGGAARSCASRPSECAMRRRFLRPLYPGQGTAPLHSPAEPAVQDALGQLNDRTTAEKLLAELGGLGWAARLRRRAGARVAPPPGATTEVLPRVLRRWEKFQHTAAFWE